MKIYHMTEAEERFAQLVWEREPISSGELVRLCQETFGWKKSTTYTFLKKLCQQKIFLNQDATVTSLLGRDAYYQGISEQFVEKTYQGSLPRMIAAFMEKRKLSDKEILEIRQMIDDYDREG